MSKRLHLLVLVLFLCRLGSPQLTNLITKYGDFASFKTSYAKTYTSESHETYRMSVHLENLKKYEVVNTNSTYTYKAGVSYFSDLTQAEYVATYLNIKHSESLLTVMREDAFVLTKDIDWTLQNKTTIVKDMGGCGASWAFAAVSVVESYLKSRSFPNPDLSEQQIIDCATLTSASGCESGLISNALQFIKVKGITFQELYPLAATPDKRLCRNEIQGVFKIPGWKKVEKGCKNFYEVLNNSVIAALVDAYFWNEYVQGIMNKCQEQWKEDQKKEEKQRGKHAAVVVGVTKEYWKLQTSWGRKWGEEGHIRVAAGKICLGVCEEGYYPLI